MSLRVVVCVFVGVVMAVAVNAETVQVIPAGVHRSYPDNCGDGDNCYMLLNGYPGRTPDAAGLKKRLARDAKVVQTAATTKKHVNEVRKEAKAHCDTKVAKVETEVAQLATTISASIESLPAAMVEAGVVRGMEERAYQRLRQALLDALCESCPERDEELRKALLAGSGS